MSTITLRDVHKTYQIADGPPLHALDGITLDIPTGMAVAVTGASGSGKSTLLHLIAGLDQADTGQILVDGTDLSQLSARDLVRHRRRTGVVFQNFALLPALSVLDNVLLPAMATGRPTPGDTERARELLAAVGLAGRERDAPGRLSGGQQQRVAISRALLAQPTVLLADEPTGNLDSATGDDVLNLLLHLAAQRGTTTLIATHDPHIAARCDHAIHLTDGHLQ